MRRGLNIVLIALFAVLFAGIAASHVERQSLPQLAQSYLKLVPQELGAPNVITGILLTYRGIDTLGEVAVLFMVAAAVGLILGAGGSQRASDAAKTAATPSSELVQSGAQILFPLILVFAIYVIMNGHLSAGGGFQGGAVMASGVLLLWLARPGQFVDLGSLSVAESAAGVLFVLVGVVGVALAGGFLDSRVLPQGDFGSLFSAGAIPVLSLLLGVKVGCELSVIVGRFRG